MSQVIIGDILPYTQAIATGGQTVFGTNWTANAASDVVVYKTPSGSPASDATQILAYPADYSVAFIGAQQQVQVTLVVAANAGDRVTVTRQTPADRENLYTNTNFTPSMLNNDFGILTLVDQQAQLVDQKVAPRYNYSSVIVNVVDTILPILGANQGWVKNNSNTAILPYTFPASGIAPANATYITQTNQVAALPNSFQLLAGTNVTLVPGVNTLTINVSEATILPGNANDLVYYPVNGTTLAPLATANDGVLITSVLGVPSISSTLPSVVQTNITELGTVSSGVWDASTIDIAHGGTSATSATAARANLSAAESGVNADITSMTGLTGFLASPMGLKDSLGNIMLAFNYALTPTDHLSITNGTANNAAITLVSANPNGSFAIYGKGTGGVAIGSLGATTIPMSLEIGGNKITFTVPSITGTHSLTFPDADVTLVGGTMMTNVLASTHIFVGNGSNVATDVAMSGDATLANTGAITVSSIGGKAVSLGGSFTMSGAHTFTGNLTGNTNVTFPTSGTLATTNGTLVNIITDSGTASVSAGAITISGGTTGLTTTGSGSTVNLTGVLSLANGGTNHALTASAGGIVWSDASKLNILSGTSTANQILLSGNAATPAWSTTTYPSTNAINTIMYASSANVLGVITPVNNAVLVSSAGGVPSMSTTLPSGLTIPSPVINQIVGTHGNTVVAFADAATVTDYFQFTSGASNSALAQLVSTNPNASFRILAQGSGGVVIGSTAATTIPMAWSNSTNSYFVMIPSWTGDRSLFLPDADVHLVGGTMLTTVTLTGDSGVATLSSSNINVTGDSTGLTFTGATNTLTLGGTLAVNHGGTGVTSVTVSPTATAFAGWNANKNMSANNFLSGYTTTVGAVGTTTLTVADTYLQYFTGSSQIVVLPVTSTLVLGQSFCIVNLGSGHIDVQSSGGDMIQSMVSGTSAILTCISTSGTTAASWNIIYSFNGGGSGIVANGTQNQLAWYAATGNKVSGLTGANSSVLVTDNSGVPGWVAGTTSGNVLTFNGTNWVSSAPVISSPLTTKGDLYTYTTTNARLAVGSTNGQMLQVSSGASTGLAWSTATFPSTATNTGRILRADGTNWVETTSTFADTYSASNLLYSNGANTVTGLATANSAALVTNSSGVPVWSSTMTNGQVILGSTGATPAAATLGAGTGLSWTTGAASLSIGLVGGLVLLGTATASNSASLSFTGLSGSSYAEYVIVIDAILAATDSSTYLYAQVSAGAGFITNSYYNNEDTVVSTTQSFNSNQGTTVFPITSQTQFIGTVVGLNEIHGEVKIIGGGTTTLKYLQAEINYFNNAATDLVNVHQSGILFPTPGAPIDGIRFLMSTGNITSGKIYLYGRKNS